MRAPASWAWAGAALALVLAGAVGAARAGEGGTMSEVSPTVTRAQSRVTFVVHAPATTPAGDVLYVSGDQPGLGTWSGSGLALARGADGLWTGTLALTAGTTFEYKLTRGDWNRVEKDAAGGEIANRRWTVTGADTVRVDVAAWRDAFEKPGAARPHTLTGDVRQHAAFPSQFVPARDVLVWLPPGYEREQHRRYPVVYFHDGQSVFDGATSFIPGQEWGADEAADALVRRGALAPCIIVAVANSPARMDEYTLTADPGHGGGGLERYGRFLLEELKPFVDRTYRTLPDAAHTGIVGSSLGGLASLDLALAHPDRFGLVGCVSPSAWWDHESLLARVQSGRGHPFRLWLDMGTAEERAVPPGPSPGIAGARRLRDALVARGWRADGDLHYEEVEGAQHNEASWRARVDRILVFLLPAPAR